MSAMVGAMSMLPATSSYVDPGVIPGPRTKNGTRTSVWNWLYLPISSRWLPMW
jgi:hypothetical protein